MRFVGWFWKIWLGGAAFLLVMLLSRLLFGAALKPTLMQVPVALLWPLALLSAEGRKRLTSLFRLGAS